MYGVMYTARRFYRYVIHSTRTQCRKLIRRYSYRDPAFKAVYYGNVAQLRSLIESGKINANLRRINASSGTTLLIEAIRYKKVEIFHYLLSLDDIDLELSDSSGKTPLLYACTNDYFALELIRKGANIYCECYGKTILHYATTLHYGGGDESNLKTGQLAIERGVDINAQDWNGFTALYFACQNLKVDWICMLLYYGADVTIYASGLGLLPLFSLEYIPYCRLSDRNFSMNNKDQILSDIQFLQDILFDYTFDNFKTSTTLENLIIAMRASPTLFSKTLEHISGVEYKTRKVEIFEDLVEVNGKDFKFLAEKFNYILGEIVDAAPIFSFLIEHCFRYEPLNLKMIIDVFLESEFVSDFIQNFEFDSSSPISSLIEKYENEISLDEITTQILIMLSYGLEVRSVDLEAVHVHHGHCHLFKFLLSFDTRIIKVK